jgi:hypothetical protein
MIVNPHGLSGSLGRYERAVTLWLRERFKMKIGKM